MRPYYLVLATLLIATGVATSSEIPTLSMGEKLFNSVNLGTTAQSCATCHKNGKGLAEIEAYSAAELREMINFCIRDALKGTTFPEQSQELNSLYLYVRHLGEKVKKP